MYFKRFDIEQYYDRVLFFDKAGNILASWTGNHDNRYSPVAIGDTIELRFIADETTSAYGFDIDFLAFE